LYARIFTKCSAFHVFKKVRTFIVLGEIMCGWCEVAVVCTERVYCEKLVVGGWSRSSTASIGLKILHYRV